MYVYIYTVYLLLFFYCDYYYSKSQEDGTINSQSVSRISLFYCTYIYIYMYNSCSAFIFSSCELPYRITRTPQSHSPVTVPRSQGVGFQGQLLNETNLSNLVPLANVTTVLIGGLEHLDYFSIYWE